jgi:hypothetical protein
MDLVQTEPASWVAARRVTLAIEEETVSFGDLCGHLHKDFAEATACGGDERTHIFSFHWPTGQGGFDKYDQLS